MTPLRKCLASGLLLGVGALAALAFSRAYAVPRAYGCGFVAGTSYMASHSDSLRPAGEGPSCASYRGVAEDRGFPASAGEAWWR